MMLGVDEPAGGGVNTRGDEFETGTTGKVVAEPLGVSCGTVASGLDELGVDVSGALVGTEGA